MDTIRLFVHAVVRDKNGRVIFQRRWRAHSLTQHFAELMYIQMNPVGGTSVTIKAEDGTNSNNSVNAANFRCGEMDTIGNADQHGIIVGSGATAPAINDFKLSTKIAHGAGAGQLSYGLNAYNPIAAAPLVLTPVGNTVSFELARSFTNNSVPPASINVQECGILVQPSTTVGAKKTLIDHTLTGSIDIPAAGVLTITYTVSITV